MRSLASLLLLSAFAAPLLAAPPQVDSELAWDVSKSAPNAALRDPGYPASAVSATGFPVIAQARIDALRLDNSAPLAKLLRIGVEREAALEANAKAGALSWQAAPGGGRTARLQATSPGALALRLALDTADLPAGAELRFFGDDASVVYTAGAAEVAKVLESQPRYWGPVTDGETQTVELFLPEGADSRWARPRLGAVSHFFVSPTGSLAGAKIGESDDCEFDAKCISSPAAYLEAKNAVVRMLFQTGGSGALCTGTLLNDTDAATQVPHLFSAAHCFTSQSVASTLTTFWFYEATGCGTGVLDASQRQVSGGSTIEFANAGSDVLMVRLNNAPPAGAVYMGWNAATLTTGANILALHHPAGDVKKVSLGEVKGFGGSNLASGQFIKVGYTDGTTEGGSSGCGLLTLSSTGGYQLRGGLLGGTASCDNTGVIATAANSDDFSRFDQVFPSLQSFLAPTATPPPSNVDYTGIYNDPAQSGWGLAVVRGASGTYAVNLYHYDQDNKTAWYLSTGQFAGTTYSQSIIALTGPWFGIVPYNPASVAVRAAGTISLQFTTDTTANVSFTIDGRTVTTTVRKLAF